MRKSFVVAVGLASLVLASTANATTDLQLVSMKPDVHRATVGGPVTWTIVARANGPDVGYGSLYIVEDPGEWYPGVYPLVDFWDDGQTCIGGPTGHVNPDGTACEFDQAMPGDEFTAIVHTTVKDSAPSKATNRVCVVDGSDRPDANPANNCLTKTVRIIGRH